MDAKPLLSIRPATVEDVALVARLIRELAEYERLADAAVATEADLREQLFGERPAAEVLIGEADGEPAGFACSSHNFSTFLGKRGCTSRTCSCARLPRPRPRPAPDGGAGADRGARGCGRSEWSVLDWNAPRSVSTARSARRHGWNGRCSGCKARPRARWRRTAMR